MLSFFRRRKALTVVLLLLAVYLGVRLKLSPHCQQAGISIGSKNFTESILIGELYAQSLERKGYLVHRRFNLGGTLIAHEAVKAGEIDLYPEYTGTGLIDVLHVGAPKNEHDAYQLLSSEYARQWHLAWLTPSKANNSQGLVMRQSLARQLHISDLSGLAKRAGQLRLGSIAEFEERPDGLKGLQHAYGGFRFKSTALYDNGLKYRILRRGDVDVTVAFTTDGALSEPDFLLLRDDRQFWPDYHVAPVVRQEALNEHPEMAAILNQISATLETNTLQRLNYQVDQQKRDYRQVVRQYLATIP